MHKNNIGQNAFDLSFQSNFNEQFNRDYARQQEILSSNPRFTRTIQSVEGERRDTVGDVYEHESYPMWQENTLKPTTIRKNLVGGQTVECNMLNQIFFSAENIENLQTRIRYSVWLESDKKHIIGRQNDTELALIMRSIYLTYGKNLPLHIQQQVRDLNDLVVRDAVSKILSQIEQHLMYLFHKSTQPMPLQLPVSMSSAGTKTLPSVTSLFYT